MSEVTFIRRNGKIIPIRRKKKKEDNKAKASLKAAGSAAVLAGSVGASAKQVQKSRPLFREAAQMRGISKLAKLGSEKRSEFISRSARAKVKALKFQSRGRGILAIGSLASSLLAGSAAADLVEGDRADEVATFVSSAVPFLGALAFRRAGKVRFGGRDPKSVFKNIQKFGEKQSRDVVRSFEKAAFKGTKRKGQISMDFPNEKRQNNLRKFLKGF